MTPPDIDEQLSCVAREISLRERVYKTWTYTGRMTKQKADHEIACMKAVLGTLMAHKAMSGPKVR